VAAAGCVAVASATELGRYCFAAAPADAREVMGRLAGFRAVVYGSDGRLVGAGEGLRVLEDALGAPP
jgi:hypothetical protein